MKITKQKIKTGIFVLGGWLTNDNGKWRTVNYLEKIKAKESGGLYGDRLRVIAASYLYYQNPEIEIIVSGGKGQLAGIKNIPNVAEVMRYELIELKVPSKNILLETKSGNTYEQLAELKKIVNKLKLDNVIILSNQYHLSRIKAMIKYLSELKPLLKITKIQFKSAEEICLKHDKNKWQTLINKANKSKQMRETIKLEKQGIKQIKNGTYNLKKYAHKNRG